MKITQLWSTLKRRRAILVLTALGIAFITLTAGGWFFMIRMPGTSYRGPLPPLSTEEEALKSALRLDVEKLADEIGFRDVEHYENLCLTVDFLETSFVEAGYEVRKGSYEVEGKTCYNIEVEIEGIDRPNEIVVVGAHYDSIVGSPAANDNASGVAATLALARAFSGKSLSRTLRFVAFVNEEPPYFQTPLMGSVVYARGCRQYIENITAMLSLETIGYYSDEKGSQRYPFPLSFIYPSTGDFIGFVGNVASGQLVRQAVKSFRSHTQFPSEGGVFPSAIPGVGWSDHWSFWQENYPAVMVTDTAVFRYPYYHTPQDTPDKIDFDRMARVVKGLEHVVVDLTGGLSSENSIEK